MSETSNRRYLLSNDDSHSCRCARVSYIMLCSYILIGTATMQCCLRLPEVVRYYKQSLTTVFCSADHINRQSRTCTGETAHILSPKTCNSPASFNRRSFGSRINASPLFLSVYGSPSSIATLVNEGNSAGSRVRYSSSTDRSHISKSPSL